MVSEGGKVNRGKVGKGLVRGGGVERRGSGGGVRVGREWVEEEGGLKGHGWGGGGGGRMVLTELGRDRVGRGRGRGMVREEGVYPHSPHLLR